MKKIGVLFLVLGLCLGLALPSYASLEEGLEVYYAFDAPFDNGQIPDLSGNDRPGTVHGDVQQAEGILKYAARFDGNEDWISGPSVNVGTGDFTVSFWFKTTDTDGYMLDARTGGTTGTGYYLISFPHPQNGIYFGVKGGVEIQTQKSGAPDGEWHMATGVRDGNKILLYIDGNLVDTKSNDQLNNADSPPICLGKRYQNSTILNYYDGLIDDFRLYSRALGADEVQELYNMSQVPIPATIWLMASGLFGLVGVRKRRN